MGLVKLWERCIQLKLFPTLTGKNGIPLHPVQQCSDMCCPSNNIYSVEVTCHLLFSVTATHVYVSVVGVVSSSAAEKGWSSGFRGRCQRRPADIANIHHSDHIFTLSVAWRKRGGGSRAVQSPLGEPQLKNCRSTLESEHIKTQDVDTTPGAVGSFATVCLAAVCSIWSLLCGFKVRKILLNNGETWWQMSISGLFSNWSNCEIAGGRFLGYSKDP